jgi:hypothetical protein
MKNAQQELEEEQLNKEQEMGVEKAEKSLNKDGYKEYVKSLITFNKGGDWKRIKSPERDVEGKKYDCGDECYLNLYGISSEITPYYSVDSAVGLIIANGSVGHYLSTENDKISTFLSRDGGLNWFEIKKGSHIYEIGDHGALILIAEDGNPTNEIFYSWDEGLTFEPLKISDEKFLIRNIIIEPTSTSQHFVIYGESQSKGSTKGVVIGIDFSGLHEPQCRNPDIPDTNESDYEKWTPNDGRIGNDCLMGHKTIYIRRKRESKCYNGLTFERKTIVEHCDCTESDYECDYGFARSAPGEPCVDINKTSLDSNKENLPQILTAPENCHGYYKISRGYRKVPGNTCINGIKFDPILIPCPNSGFFAGLGMIFFVLIVSALVVIIYIVFNNYSGPMCQNNLVHSANLSSTKRDYVNIVKYIYLIFNFFKFFRNIMMQMIICYSMMKKLKT